MGSTNYVATFIQVADDCTVAAATAPPVSGKALTMTRLQYELIHHDDGGRVALVPVESDRYRALTADPALGKRKAMRSKRK